ncbi:MAG: DUF167 domain-containing protein [Lentisphaeria bacterium]|nr:DUF167 domain-containing protein [Lentisphaeria bacterium]
MPDFARVEASGAILLKLRVRPGAKSTGVAGAFGDALKIELQAPPVDGKANAALIRFLADKLRIPRSALRIKSGESSRDKVIMITGTTLDNILYSLDSTK